ncbi:MAG: hypothetical protein U1F59_03435 [Candidatus Competibacteraceae bacterium]
MSAGRRCQTRLITAPTPEATPRVHVPPLGEVAADSLSPAFTVVLAGLDAHLRAFFVLLFLLSLPAHQKSRSRMSLIGGIFVLTRG